MENTINDLSSRKKHRKVFLFPIVMICVTSYFGVYKLRLSKKLQEESLNSEALKILQPTDIDHSSIKRIGEINRNAKCNKCDIYDSIFNIKKSCFYLSRKKMRELPIRDYHVNSKDANTILKRNQNSTMTKSNPCSRFLTVGTFGGRMGNHMFRIASMLGEAYRNDIIPVIPKKSVLNKYINLPNVVDTADKMPENLFFCKSKYPGHCIRAANITHSIILTGQMQSWKYFDDIKHIITSAFRIKRVHILNAHTFIRKVTVNNLKNVCIHIRRGDFLKMRRQAAGFAVANASYIERAKEFFIQNYSSVQFISLSTDKEWCRKNIKDAIMSPFTDAGDDMALMSLCDHVIITSGTFGWWGAWLSGGTTVYFKGYPAPLSHLANLVHANDYYPNRWIGI